MGVESDEMKLRKQLTNKKGEMKMLENRGGERSNERYNNGLSCCEKSTLEPSGKIETMLAIAH